VPLVSVRIFIVINNFYRFLSSLGIYFSFSQSDHRRAITQSLACHAGRIEGRQDEARKIALLPSEFSFLLFRRIINEALENRIIKLQTCIVNHAR